MCWHRPEPGVKGLRRRRTGFIRSATVCILLLCCAGNLAAQALDLPPASGAREAWLVTYGPGEIYWQRFGHNAIWLRDPDQGIDHVFNFGYFDFSQDDFLQRFIQGRMLYFSAAQEVGREFLQYQRERRSIRIQPLALDDRQYERLRAHLVHAVQPEYRDYRYDYYLDNCSTRIRDALDVALDGAFSAHYVGMDAAQNFRDHTRRSVAADTWYYLGLEAGLGRRVDRPIDAWEEMFLPLKVADAASAFPGPEGPLAGPVHTVFPGSIPPPPATPPPSWWRYLAIGLGLFLLFALLSKMAGPVMAEGSAQAWLLINATLGGLIAFLWWGTDHAAAMHNVNILLFNPLFALGLLPALRRPVAWLMGGGLGMAAVQGAFPGAQYNLDVVALLAPLHLACAWVLLGGAGNISPWFRAAERRAGSRSA
jgi:hypothetical protein